MSKYSVCSRLPAIAGAVVFVSTVGLQVVSAAEQDNDPQTQAAHLLQRPQIWSTRMDEVLQAGRGTYQTADAHEQARRVLQPVIDATPGVTPRESMMASNSIDPQVQAARLLMRTYY